MEAQVGRAVGTPSRCSHPRPRRYRRTPDKPKSVELPHRTDVLGQGEVPCRRSTRNGTWGKPSNGPNNENRPAPAGGQSPPDQVESQFSPELGMEGDAVPADYWKIELNTAYTLVLHPRWLRESSGGRHRSNGGAGKRAGFDLPLEITWQAFSGASPSWPGPDGSPRRAPAPCEVGQVPSVRKEDPLRYDSTNFRVVQWLRWRCGVTRAEGIGMVRHSEHDPCRLARGCHR